ncbi:uncharacterized protein LOC127256629 [Andrographis paniculata]|uniref:uncharacterized protein LOC127256629 n=1 Tax=Andrographis paniculata TaxID=175694 RepID=UPI0021E79321|nr:uncharacterized protein LOC127256629 [Andrographis paniculata]
MVDIDEEFIDWHAMEFAKPDDAYNFYWFKEGSNVKPNHPEIHPNKSSESERIKIMHRSHETRTGCNSKIRLQFDKENAKYKVTNFEDNHNHDLYPPKHKHMLVSNRRIDESHLIIANTNQEAGLPIRSS